MFLGPEQVGRDLLYAVRSLGKSPIVTTVVVLSLTLGIGANTAIFSLMDTVMLRLLPVGKPEELVTVVFRHPGETTGDSSATNALWEAVRDHQDVFSGVFSWSLHQFDLAQGGTVHYVKGAYVSGNYFSTLNIVPAAGRLIATDDDTRGCTPTAVLSYGFWQTHFNGAESALGSTISLNRQAFQVIGVSAQHFYGVEVGKTFDVAIPICASALFDKRNIESHSRWWLSTMGRVKPGMARDKLNARLEVLSPEIMQAALQPEADAAEKQRFLQTRLGTTPAGTGVSGLRGAFGGPLNILMVIVAVVLLIACANIASLLLARATTRSREIAIRKALGASRSRVVHQLLTESLLLSVLGAGLGVLFAKWGSALLVRNLSTGRNPVFLDLSLDGRILGFTAVVAVLTGMLIGLLPALWSTRVALTAAMKGSLAAGGEERSQFGIGKWIVGGQVALSLVLLIGGGLLLRTFVKLLTLDIGFDRNNVLLLSTHYLNLDTTKVPPEKRAVTYEEIGHRLRALPGVVSVARSFTTPIGDDNWVNTVHPDAPGAPTGDNARVFLNFVTPGYFATLRTPLMAGRDFDKHDTATSAPVAIVNQTMARKFFPGLNALGRHFRKWEQPARVEIVGIVKDSKYGSVREETLPTVFLPDTQAPQRGEAENFELRTSLPPSALIAAIQRVMAEVNKDLPLEFHTLGEQVDDNLVQERLLATLSGFFGIVALLLAMIGLYGVLSYVVTQRQVEFGIRVALGAPPDVNPATGNASGRSGAGRRYSSWAYDRACERKAIAEYAVRVGTTRHDDDARGGLSAFSNGTAGGLFACTQGHARRSHGRDPVRIMCTVCGSDLTGPSQLDGLSLALIGNASGSTD